MYNDYYEGYNYIGNNNNRYNYNNTYPEQYRNFNSPSIETRELEENYPEIYKIVYPMVAKACSNYSQPMNNNIINNLTNEIYLAIEEVPEVNTTIDSKNNTRHSNNNNNNILKDLIRILILRELLSRPQYPGGGRPPYPPRPPRPRGFSYL